MQLRLDNNYSYFLLHKIFYIDKERDKESERSESDKENERLERKERERKSRVVDKYITGPLNQDQLNELVDLIHKNKNILMNEAKTIALYNHLKTFP